MGADQSNELKSQQQYQMFILQYSKEREHQHYQYGQVKLYNHNQNNSMICVKKYQTKSDTELQQINNHLRRRKIFTHPNLVQLMAVRTSNDQSMCSDASQVLVVSEYFADTLKSELDKHKQKRYSEQHVWLMIQQIVDPCAFLEEQKQSHGDLKPQTIYLDENGSVKLSEYDYLPGGQPGFQKMILSIDKAYLSPILLTAYRNMNFKPNHNEYKSDVFSFGLTLLEVLLSEESYDCMDFQNGCILEQVVEQKLQKIKKLGYSQLLSNFIRELLQLEESVRPSWFDLKQVVNQFRDKINNFVPFYQDNKRTQSPIRMVFPQRICSPQSQILSPQRPQMVYSTYQPYQVVPPTLYQTKQLPMHQSIYYEDKNNIPNTIPQTTPNTTPIQNTIPVKKKLEETSGKGQRDSALEKTTAKQQSDTK